MECKSCSGTKFKRLAGGGYKCIYCGRISLDKSSLEGKANKAPLKNSAPLLIAAAISFILIAATVLYFVSVRDSRPLQTETSRKPLTKPSPANTPANTKDEGVPEAETELTEYGASSIEKRPEAKGEFVDISVIPDSIGNFYFFGRYKNIGKSPLRKPKVELTLYDANKVQLASGKGYSMRDFLLPGEESFIKILVNKPGAYSSYKISHEAKHPYQYDDTKRPKLTFHNVSMSEGDYGYYHVEGVVKNESPKGARFVQIKAIAFDKEKRITGGSSRYLKEKQLGPNASSQFTIKIITLKSEPSSFKLEYNARFVK